MASNRGWLQAIWSAEAAAVEARTIARAHDRVPPRPFKGPHPTHRPAQDR